MLNRGIVPNAVRSICERLKGSGHEAWCVGGAVRDALLGQSPGDWDVTTSATPDVVQSLFARTIPTGVEHGTVTVVEGRGKERLMVEVTTFRGEHGYSDARRPDRVVFGVSLAEDLARRDFTINAIAFDPAAEKTFDPFSGREDLANRVIRAVGVARDRFVEDGLRIMRALRFLATLDFSLDASTRDAIPAALPSLARVAVERVRVELVKLLAGRGAHRALREAAGLSVLDTILPEISPDVRDGAIDRVEHSMADAFLRMAALVTDLPLDAVDRVLRRLRFSNQDRLRVASGARGLALLRGIEPIESDVRRALAAIGRIAAEDTLFLAEAEAARVGRAGERLRSVQGVARAILARKDPLAVSELAIRGADLVAAGVPPGPAVGALLAELLERVLDDPNQNLHSYLLQHAMERWQSRAPSS